LILDELITDRTERDVERAKALLSKPYSEWSEEERTKFEDGMKGAYNVSDLTRVGNATSFLAKYLAKIRKEIILYMDANQVAVQTAINPYIDEDIANVSVKSWAVDEIPSASKLGAYLDAVNLVVSQMKQNWGTPETINKLTYRGANAIEKALISQKDKADEIEAELKDRVDRTVSAFIYSDEIFSDELEGWR
jgi:hypothetical protein